MNRKRPTSESELTAILKAAYSLACKSQYDEALEICNWIIEDKTTEVAGLRERAAVKEHMNDVVGAIVDLNSVIKQFNNEPADFHALGLLLLKNGDTVQAIDSFDRAILLGEKTNNSYYTNSSLLHRAEAYLKRTDFAEVLADTDRLPVGYQTHISGSGMRSKEQLSAEANAALARKAKSKFRKP